MLMKMPGLVMINLIWGWLMTWLSIMALGKLSKCCVCTTPISLVRTCFEKPLVQLELE